MSSFSQELICRETTFFGGVGCNTEIKDAIRETSGNIVFIGYSDCDNGDIPITTYGKMNVMVGSCDSTGKLIWMKIFGGTNNDMGYKIIKLKDRCYALLGTTESNDGDFQSSHTTNGIRDVFLMKLDSSGNKLWEKSYGGDGDNESLSMIELPDGSISILGAFTVAGNDIPFSYSSSPFLFDWFLLTVDQSGGKKWLKVYGGTGDEQTSGSLLYFNRKYYIAASSSSNDYDCFDTSWHNNNSLDFFLIKLNDTGEFIWSRSYGGSKSDALKCAIYDSTDQSIVMVGNSTSNDFMVIGNHGKADMLLVKADTNGSLDWGRCFGGVEDETEQCLTGNSKDGYWAYTNSYSPKLGVSGSDTWLFLIDSSGSSISDKVIGGTGIDQQAAVLPSNNQLFVLGTSNSYQFVEGTSNGKKGIADNGFLTWLYYFPTTIVPIYGTRDILSIYPNPAMNSFIVSIPNNNKVGVLEVYSSSGQKVYNRTISANLSQIKIETTCWIPGSYYVVWKSDSKTYHGSISCK
ncbi:MAG: T9SS type A sorting domain-containing protein [Bacteroidetes bacterium]|nr:T9SS type A sorting domain-containing protein [Bacteroidota bacterium]